MDTPDRENKAMKADWRIYLALRFGGWVDAVLSVAVGMAIHTATSDNWVRCCRKHNVEPCGTRSESLMGMQIAPQSLSEATICGKASATGRPGLLCQWSRTIRIHCTARFC